MPLKLLRPQDSSAYPAPEAVYNWRVYALAISAAMGSAMFGYDIGFIGGSMTLPSFRSKFGLDRLSGDILASLNANIVSLFQAGAFFASILVSYFAERLGRKIPLMFCGALWDVGVILQVASNGSVGLLYGGRVLTGAAVGASSLVIPQYISECSPPAIRGRLIGIFEMVLQIASVIGFWINYGVNQHISPTSNTQWRIPFSLQFVFGTLLIILMTLQPESPRWLIKQNKISQATQKLSYIRNLPEDHEYIQWEVQNIRQQLEREAEVNSDRSFWLALKECFGPGMRSRLYMGMGLMLLQNLSGINALNYYSPEIFKSIGFRGTSVSLLATGVFGLINCSCTIIYMIFGIDRVGRRWSLIIGSVGVIIAMFYISAFTKLSGSFQGLAKKDGGAYAAIFMIYFYTVFYAISWNGIPWIFCAEVFPTGVRSICLVFTTCMQWLGQFIVVYSTPYMMTNITYGTFLFFAASVVVGLFIVYFLMPETKGLSLEEMDILYDIPSVIAINQRKKADAIIAAQREVGGLVDSEKLSYRAQEVENAA
ncbi:hypothetical protein M433DRAFT_73491 [Acidomyces richmondensis BFW]|nr:MAG: hypothetical protein FE78DRAFT_151005 [Acidomyces sp. 'richmondensis']KYG42574.1 hypothetical protein M433DRAFT_73491 [Acidomyces richmondensis BFW]